MGTGFLPPPSIDFSLFSAADSEHRALCFGHDVVRGRLRSMARERLSRLGAHNDQVCLRLPGRTEDFLRGGAEGYTKHDLAPVLAFRRHKLLHLLKVELAYAL